MPKRLLNFEKNDEYILFYFLFFFLFFSIDERLRIEENYFFWNNFRFWIYNGEYVVIYI